MAQTKHNSNQSEYEFSRIVSQLENYEGQNTELISLYIPPDKSLSSVRQYISDEKAEAENIKSKQTRKNVLAALKSIISRLQYYDTIPSDGLAIFSGRLTNNTGDIETIVLSEFPHPIQTFKYHCDSNFELTPLEKLAKMGDKYYGLVVLDRRDAQIGVLSGDTIIQKATTSSRVPGKHTAGGQSQARFERLRQEAIQNFYQEVASLINETFFSERHNIDGILIGGPSPTKEEFVKTPELHHELEDKIVGLFNISDTTERGLTSLVEAGETTISQSQIVKQRQLMQKFFTELKQSEKTVYGWEETIEYLELGAVETILVSDEIQQVKIFNCVNDHSTVYKNQKKKCSICQSTAGELEEVDGSEYIQMVADSRGSTVHYISTSFEEGSQLKSVFGGIAGLLRYNPK